MSKVSKRTSFLGLTLLLAALAFGTKRMSAAGDARPAAAAPAAKAAGAGAGAGAGQFFELRVYTAAPGKMDALNKRFREHSLKFFEKHGIKSVGYWTAVDE